MASLTHVATSTEDRSSTDGERCPWCGQSITHEKFVEIRDRIAAKERERSAEVERRLKAEVAREKTEAEARAKTEVEKIRKDAAAAVEKGKREASAKLQAAAEAGRKVAETAMKPKLAEAEKGKLLAQQQLDTFRKSQQTAMKQRLQEQRSALEKDKTDAVNAERSKHFQEKLKLEEKLGLLQRQLQRKTADELGEGAEVDLFEALKRKFPEDDIKRVGKGNEGADIIHRVFDSGRACGCIVYDSKNRNAWRNEYVAKLRKDQLGAKADHAILTTQAFPAGARQLHLQDGVIVLNPARTLVLVEMLRKHITQTHALRLSTEGQADKMARLYEFITSERCAQLLEQIETQADNMLDLDVSEKKTHDATWKRRGELIRSVQRAHGDLLSEVDRITGASAAARSEQST